MKKSILLIGTLLFLISPAVHAEWNFMFANMKYNKNITAEAYLMSTEKLIALLKDKDVVSITPETVGELKSKRIYYVVRLKNNGNPSAWGSLGIDVDGFGHSLIDARDISRKEYSIYVAPGFLLSNRDSASIPKVNITWLKLYTK